MEEDDFSILYQDIPPTEYSGTGMIDESTNNDNDQTNIGPPIEVGTFSGIHVGLMAFFIGAGIFGALMMILIPLLFIITLSTGTFELGYLYVSILCLLLVSVGYFGIHNLIFRMSIRISPDGFELYKKNKRMVRAPWESITKIYTKRPEGNGPEVLGILTRDGYDIKVSMIKIKTSELKKAYRFMIPYSKHYLITLDNELGW